MIVFPDGGDTGLSLDRCSVRLMDGDQLYQYLNTQRYSRMLDWHIRFYRVHPLYGCP